MGFYAMVRAYIKIRHILKQRIGFAQQIKAKATLIEYKCGKNWYFKPTMPLRQSIE